MITQEQRSRRLYTSQLSRRSSANEPAEAGGNACEPWEIEMRVEEQPVGEGEKLEIAMLTLPRTTAQGEAESYAK